MMWILEKAELISKNAHTLYIGIFFLSLAIVSFVAVLKSRKAKISETINRLIKENPNKIMAYRFGEDRITVNQTSAMVQANIYIEYSYVSNAVKIDGTSFYFTTRNGLHYLRSGGPSEN